MSTDTYYSQMMAEFEAKRAAKGATTAIAAPAPGEPLADQSARWDAPSKAPEEAAYTLTHPLGEQALAWLAAAMQDPSVAAQVESQTEGYLQLCEVAAQKALRKSESAGGIEGWESLGVSLSWEPLAAALYEYVLYDAARALAGLRKFDLPNPISEYRLAIGALVKYALRLLPDEIDAHLPLYEGQRITTAEVRNQIADRALSPVVSAALSHMARGASRERRDAGGSDLGKGYAQTIKQGLGRRHTGSGWDMAVKVLTRRANFRKAASHQIMIKGVSASLCE